MKQKLIGKRKNVINIPAGVMLFFFLMGSLFLKAKNSNQYLFLGREKEVLKRKLEIAKNEKIQYIIRINELENITYLEKISKKYDLVYHQKVYPIYPLEKDEF